MVVLKFIVGIGFLALFWLFSFTTVWSSLGSQIQPTEFEFMQIRDDGLQATNPESYKMTMNCYGFEGQCEFETLNLKLTLVFEGIKISKPFYNLGLWGGNSGWQFRQNYFGKRVLTVSTRDGKQLGVFTQTMWNVSAYSDFSQILFFDLGKRQVRISARDAFFAARELAFVVQY